MLCNILSTQYSFKLASLYFNFILLQILFKLSIKGLYSPILPSKFNIYHSCLRLIKQLLTHPTVAVSL